MQRHQRGTPRCRREGASTPSPNDSGGEADRGEEVSRQPVVSGEDAAEVFEAAEGVLDAMPLLVGFLVEAEWLDAVGPVGDNRLGATIIEPMPQLSAVIGGVTEQLGGRLGASDKALGGRTIMGLAAGQEDGK